MKNVLVDSKIHNLYFSSALQTFNRNFLLFIAYSVFGWVIETSYIAAVNGHFAHRGLIDHGLPLIPLFGYCGLIMVHLLLPLKKKPLLVFCSSVLLTTLAEYLTSMMNTHIFHVRTWDYSNIPFSFEGRIALPISLGWGLLALLVIYWLDPLFKKLIRMIRLFPATLISWSLLIYIIVCLGLDLYRLGK